MLHSPRHRWIRLLFAAALLALALAACSQSEDAAALAATGIDAPRDVLVAIATGPDGETAAIVAREDLPRMQLERYLPRRAGVPDWIHGNAPLPVRASSGCDALTERFGEAVYYANTYQLYASLLRDGTPLLRVTSKGSTEYGSRSRVHRRARGNVYAVRNAGYTRVMELIGLLEDAGCTTTRAGSR